MCLVRSAVITTNQSPKKKKPSFSVGEKTMGQIKLIYYTAILKFMLTTNWEKHKNIISLKKGKNNHQKKPKTDQVPTSPFMFHHVM